MKLWRNGRPYDESVAQSLCWTYPRCISGPLRIVAAFVAAGREVPLTLWRCDSSNCDESVAVPHLIHAESVAHTYRSPNH